MSLLYQMMIDFLFRARRECKQDSSNNRMELKFNSKIRTTPQKCYNMSDIRHLLKHKSNIRISNSNYCRKQQLKRTEHVFKNNNFKMSRFTMSKRNVPTIKIVVRTNTAKPACKCKRRSLKFIWISFRKWRKAQQQLMRTEAQVTKTIV